MLRHGSLFSGIGGFDLAAEWMGWTNVFHCEIDKFNQRILKHYWPEAISYEDIKTTNFTIHRGAIDILTGGFPCQPYSLAGKRKGKEDDRHLWPEMLRAIRELQPSFIVGENVYGLVNWDGGLVFNEVQTDLENEGYEVQPVVLPACSVDAPHRRDRVWFIAYSNSYRQHRRNRENEKYPDKGREYAQCYPFTNVCNGIAADTCNSRRDNGGDVWERRQSKIYGSGVTEKSKPKRQRFWDRACAPCAVNEDTLFAAYPNNKRQEQQPGDEEPNKQRQYSRLDATGGFATFPTQPPICGGNDGLPSELDGITFSKWRRDSIKGYGNAIVPQVALQIFKVIEQLYINH